MVSGRFHSRTCYQWREKPRQWALIWCGFWQPPLCGRWPRNVCSGMALIILLKQHNSKTSNAKWTVLMNVSLWRNRRGKHKNISLYLQLWSSGIMKSWLNTDAEIYLIITAAKPLSVKSNVLVSFSTFNFFFERNTSNQNFGKCFGQLMVEENIKKIPQKRTEQRRRVWNQSRAAGNVSSTKFCWKLN